MPCYQQRTTTLDAPAANLDLMAKALEALGEKVLGVDEVARAIVVEGGTWKNGTYTVTRTTAPTFDANALRREYAKQTILSQAKRQGWQLRFTATGEIEATRRRFA